MAGDTLKYVKSGEALVIPAPAYNAFVDAAVDFRNRRQSGGSNPFDVNRQTAIIKVRNDSGADLEQFGVLQLDAPLFDVTADLIRNPICFSGISVTEPAIYGYAVALEPIEDDRIGRCVVSGICIAKVNITSIVHRWAHPVAASALLTSDGWGSAQILWAEAAGSDKYALLNLAALTNEGVVGKLTSTLARGGSATMDAYYLDAAGDFGDPTGESFTIVDSRMLTDDSSPLDIDVRVFGHWYGGVLMLEGFDCDLET